MTSDNPFRLDNDLALITGGGSGIGLAIATRFLAAGATVIITGRREEPLKQATQSLGPACSYLVHDVTNLKSAPDLISQIQKRHGSPPAILINNAGHNLKKPALDTTEEEFQSLLQTHVLGSFALTRAAAPHMIQQKRGSILFIASMASLFGIPQVIAYTAAKSAYTGMVRALAVELSPHNVRINAIAPGWIDTEMLRKAFKGDPDREKRIRERTPMNRLGETDDIACAALYLASPAAKFVTGTTLIVDGGISIGF